MGSYDNTITIWVREDGAVLCGWVRPPVEILFARATALFPLPASEGDPTHGH